MQFNKMLGCTCLLLAAVSSYSVAEKTAWNVVVKSSEAAYWQASKEAVSAELEYVKASKALKQQGQPQQSQAALREQLETLGFQFDGEQIVTQPDIPAPEITSIPTSTPDPVFGWKRISLGQAAGQPYVELKHHDTGEIQTLIHGDTIDGWTVSIHNARVTVSKNGFRKSL